MMLAACAVGPDYQAPQKEVARSFDNIDATYSTDQGAAQFWQSFADPQLDQLVGEALASNHDLRIAMTRVREARALRRDAAFDLAPAVNAGGGYTKTRTSAETTLPGTSRESSYYDAGFDAFWELDFFGGVRRGLEASDAALGAEEAAMRDTQVIVTAEITRAYFELRGQQLQLDVARRNVANQQSTLDLAKVRLEAGSGTEFDTARAQAQLSATHGTIGPLEAAVAGIPMVRALSVLEGQARPGPFKDVLGDLVEDVSSGTPLSESMEKHGRAFDRLYSAMVRAGEAGGVLDAVLERLAAYRERAAALRSKVVNALIYPLVIVVVAVSVISAVIVWVIPRFRQIFDSFGVELPTLTQVLLDVSSFSAIVPDLPVR
jgi:hypothetical protein